MNPILQAFRSSGDKPSQWVLAFAEFDTYGGHIGWDNPRHWCHPFTVATDDELSLARKVIARLDEVAA